MESKGTLGLIASYFGRMENWKLLFRVNLLSSSNIIEVIVLFGTSLP